MKNILFILFLLFTNTVYLVAQKPNIVNIAPTGNALSESDQRKFEFFLFEGARAKMLNNLEEATADYAQCYAITKFSPVVLYELSHLMNSKIGDNISFMETASTLEPTNIFYLNYLANLYFQAGLNSKGISTYEKIFTLNPSDNEFIYTLARTAGYFGDYSTSIKYFNLLQYRIGVNYNLTAGKVEVYDKCGKKNEAIKCYKELIKAYPNNKEYVLMLGQYYMSILKTSKAMEIFSSLQKESTISGEASLSMALVFLARRDTSAAVSYFRNGLSDTNLSGQRKMTYIKSLKKKDSYVIYLQEDRTVEFLELIYKSSPDDVEAPLTLAFYYDFEKKNKELALNYYLKATQFDPSQYEPRKFLLSHLGANNMYIDIITHGKEALLYYPEDPTILYYYGVACSIDGKDLLAISSFETALHSIQELDGDNSSISVGINSSLGDCYYRVDSIQKSFKAYEEVLRLDPNNVIVLNNYAYFLAEKGIDLARAEVMSAKVIQLEPGNATYLDTYAWVLFKLHRYAEAKFIIERAIDNGGDVNDVLLEHYGDILSFSGSSAEAIKYWKMALDKGSKNPSLLEKINKGVYIE